MSLHDDARTVRHLLAEHLGNDAKRQERDARHARVLGAMAAWEQRDAEQRWAVRYSRDYGKTFTTEGPLTPDDAQKRLRQLWLAAEPVWCARVEPWPETRPAA